MFSTFQFQLSPSDHHQFFQAGSNSYLAAAKRAKAENGTAVGAVNGVTANGQTVPNGAVTSAGLSAAAAGMPLYAQTPQFNPYLVPAAQFLPAVSCQFLGNLKKIII